MIAMYYDGGGASWQEQAMDWAFFLLFMGIMGVCLAFVILVLMLMFSLIKMMWEVDDDEDDDAGHP